MQLSFQHRYMEQLVLPFVFFHKDYYYLLTYLPFKSNSSVICTDAPGVAKPAQILTS